MTEPKQTAELADVYFVKVGHQEIAWGYIYNDATARFRDGTLIRTSLIVKKNLDEKWFRTLNTTYKILKLHEEGDDTGPVVYKEDDNTGQPD